MKIILPAILLLSLSLTSCKKTVEKIKEDRISKIMADGQWKVTRYTAGSEYGAEFQELVFQFFENKTVNAYQNGNLIQSGSWDGDVDAKTIWANFGNTATAPLPRLNKTWSIMDNSFVFVEAIADGASMRLEKVQ